MTSRASKLFAVSGAGPRPNLTSAVARYFVISRTLASLKNGSLKLEPKNPLFPKPLRPKLLRQKPLRPKPLNRLNPLKREKAKDRDHPKFGRKKL